MYLRRRSLHHARRVAAGSVLVRVPVLDWARDPELDGAACARPGIDPDMFFPDPADTRAIEAATAFCRTCPVQAACLAKALARREKYGVFGGRLFQPRPRNRAAVTSEEVEAA